jgi:hypothetical protein
VINGSPDAHIFPPLAQPAGVRRHAPAGPSSIVFFRGKKGTMICNSSPTVRMEASRKTKNNSLAGVDCSPTLAGLLLIFDF